MATTIDVSNSPFSSKNSMLSLTTIGIVSPPFACNLKKYTFQMRYN